MVLEWREHEHGEVEEAVREDLMAQQAYVHADSTTVSSKYLPMLFCFILMQFLGNSMVN